MTPASPPNCQLLAKGLNPDDGGTEMVNNETDSGGAVFSASSISYPCSLPVDENISTITKTVMERFVTPLRPNSGS